MTASFSLHLPATLRALCVLGAVMAGGGALGPSALAQPAPAAESSPTPTAGALTVVAPRVMRRQVAGTARFQGSPIEVLSLAHTVNFGDLDLTTPAGVEEFQKRIMYSALDACNEIEAEYPSNVYVPIPPDQNCPDTTARAALAVARNIISAARAHDR
jgi:UrcA family protein